MKATRKPTTRRRVTKHAHRRTTRRPVKKVREMILAYVNGGGGAEFARIELIDTISPVLPDAQQLAALLCAALNALPKEVEQFIHWHMKE